MARQGTRKLNSSLPCPLSGGSGTTQHARGRKVTVHRAKERSPPRWPCMLALVRDGVIYVRRPWAAETRLPPLSRACAWWISACNPAGAGSLTQSARRQGRRHGCVRKQERRGERRVTAIAVLIISQHGLRQSQTVSWHAAQPAPYSSPDCAAAAPPSLIRLSVGSSEIEPGPATVQTHSTPRSFQDQDAAPSAPAPAHPPHPPPD